MYKDVSAWEVDFNKVAAELPSLVEYKEQLKTADVILACLTKISEVARLLEKVYVWANLKDSEDISDEATSICLKRVQKLWNDFGQAVSFIDPELVKLEDEFLDTLIADQQFSDFVMQLKQVKREKPHVLSKKEEALLARAGMLWDDPYNIFSNFDNVDAHFGKVKDETGAEVAVTHGNYSTLLEKQDRGVRQAAFEAVYKEYEGHIHTLTEVLGAVVKQHDFLREVRNYESAAAAALHGKNVDVEVYHNLIKQVHKRLDVVYKYVEKRKSLLDLDEIRMWDLRVPVMGVELKFSFDEAIELCVEAAKPLGDDYVKVLEEGLRGGWVDKYETKGKRSGAFSSGCYDSWPYILMNFDGTLNDVFTLMHEAGHSMHSYLANQNQPYSLANYPIFTAEIASTVNERLLTDHLLKTWEGDRRLAVLHHEIDTIRATFFRQTMFAEFELMLHETVAKGVPITKDFLCDQYEAMNKLYYGPTMSADAYIKFEWARIPHFYYDFYVYQYATGIAAAYNFAEHILSGDADRYLNLLKSGGSDYPLNLLKKAGLDMTQDFYGPIFSRFEELVEQI